MAELLIWLGAEATPGGFELPYRDFHSLAGLNYVCIYYLFFNYMSV